MADVDLPELPRAFEGEPYGVKLDAFRRAQATLPIPAIRMHLGEAVLDEALILATCLGLREAAEHREGLNRILARLSRASGKGRKTIGAPAP